MSERIILVDVDRPEEPLEVDVEQFTHTQLRLVVPNTSVRFELCRFEADSPFEGSLGGRYYIFDPDASAKQRSPRA